MVVIISISSEKMSSFTFISTIGLYRFRLNGDQEEEEEGINQSE